MRPLTINQFAARHSVSRQRIWFLISTGRIPLAYRLGRTWAIPENASIKRGR